MRFNSYGLELIPNATWGDCPTNGEMQALHEPDSPEDVRDRFAVETCTYQCHDGFHMMGAQPRCDQPVWNEPSIFSNTAYCRPDNCTGISVPILQPPPLFGSRFGRLGNCRVDGKLLHGESCLVLCPPGYIVIGDQPSCWLGNLTFSVVCQAPDCTCYDTPAMMANTNFRKSTEPAAFSGDWLECYEIPAEPEVYGYYRRLGVTCDREPEPEPMSADDLEPIFVPWVYASDAFVDTKAAQEQLTVHNDETATTPSYLYTGGDTVPGLQSCTVARYLQLHINVTAIPPPAEKVLRVFEWEVLGRPFCQAVCRNGGVCSGRTCNCPLNYGWSGPNCTDFFCSREPGSVSRNPCQHGGKCVGPNLCDCPRGYTGIWCHLETCGDAIAAAPETCDDGNTVSGDGCSDTCALEVGCRWLGDEQGLLAPVVSEPEPEPEPEPLGCLSTCHNGGWCDTDVGVCLCPDRLAYTGLYCDVPICFRGCDHGGLCLAPDLCSGCLSGWTGKYCGTADEYLVPAFVALFLFVAVTLTVAVFVVLKRKATVLVARGVVSFMVSLLAPILWLYAEAAPLFGEYLFFDVRDAAAWKVWLRLLFFNLWFCNNVVYLRSMVVIHALGKSCGGVQWEAWTFYLPQMAFLWSFMFIACAAADKYDSAFGATVVDISWLYTILLLQLFPFVWTIRRALPDLLPHWLCSAAGDCNGFPLSSFLFLLPFAACPWC